MFSNLIDMLFDQKSLILSVWVVDGKDIIHFSSSSYTQTDMLIYRLNRPRGDPVKSDTFDRASLASSLYGYSMACNV